MTSSHHPHHPQHAQRAAKELNLDLAGPAQTITDRPTLRVDLTTKSCGLKVLTASLAPHPNPAFAVHKQALLDHDQAHIAQAARHTGAHIVIITTTHDSLHPHDPLPHYRAIRQQRKLQLHLFLLNPNKPQHRNLYEWPTVPALGY